MYYRVSILALSLIWCSTFIKSINASPDDYNGDEIEVYGHRGGTYTYQPHDYPDAPYGGGGGPVQGYGPTSRQYNMEEGTVVVKSDGSMVLNGKKVQINESPHIVQKTTSRVATTSTENSSKALDFLTSVVNFAKAAVEALFGHHRRLALRSPDTYGYGGTYGYSGSGSSSPDPALQQTLTDVQNAAQQAQSQLDELRSNLQEIIDGPFETKKDQLYSAFNYAFTVEQNLQNLVGNSYMAFYNAGYHIDSWDFYIALGNSLGQAGDILDQSNLLIAVLDYYYPS